jgi:hypothetical protein
VYLNEWTHDDAGFPTPNFGSLIRSGKLFEHARRQLGQFVAPLSGFNGESAIPRVKSIKSREESRHQIRGRSSSVAFFAGGEFEAAGPSP